MGTFNSRDRWRGREKGRERHTACGGPVQPLFHAEDPWGHKPDYKTAALCKHVRRIVSLTLSGECGDPLLQDLIVEEVLPAPNASRLLVRVMLRAWPEGLTLADILQRLAKVEGLLRARVGQAIVRKRTPELTFVVLPLIPPSVENPPLAGEEPPESEDFHA